MTPTPIEIAALEMQACARPDDQFLQRAVDAVSALANENRALRRERMKLFGQVAEQRIAILRLSAANGEGGKA